MNCVACFDLSLVRKLSGKLTCKEKDSRKHYSKNLNVAGGLNNLMSEYMF